MQQAGSGIFRAPGGGAGATGSFAGGTQELPLPGWFVAGQHGERPRSGQQPWTATLATSKLTPTHSAITASSY